MSKKGKQKKKRFWRNLLLIIIIFFCGIIAYSYTLIKSTNAASGVKAKKVGINEPVNILLLGVDAGDLDNKTDKNPRRSDTMMLIKYIPTENKIHILSIPRDTKVTINGKTQKMNAAHFFGGVPLTIETVENLLDEDINYYVKVDYEGFKKCIDAIGGIDVVPEHDMDYDAYDIQIHFKKGEKVHLDGEKAEQYVRWRKNNNEQGYATGDLGRISAQQDFMVKVYEKIKSPAGIVRIPKLLNTVAKYAETNMGPMDMLKYAFKLRKIDINNIDKSLIPGEPKYINGISYYIYDKNKKYNSNPVSKPVSNNNESKTEINKKDIKIKILNSTGVNRLASNYKDKLRDKGYDVIGIGNYDKKLNKTVIKVYNRDDYGTILKGDLKFGKIENEKDKNSSVDIVVILGSDSIK